jgi:translation initiation factor 2 subunit 2
MVGELNKTVHAPVNYMEYGEMLEKGMSEVPEETDESGRFELPDLEVESRSGSTYVRNFADVAEAIGRDAEHLADFLSDDIGTATSLQGSELEISGEFRRENVRGRIDNYLDRFVYCNECGSPDTVLTEEKEVRIVKCQACGARNVLD